jgi:hypothetical protein
MPSGTRFFVGGGGLGDAVFTLNKYRQFSPSADKPLVFLTEQSTAQRMVGQFFDSQQVAVDIRRVESGFRTLRELKREGGKILNSSWPGFSPLLAWQLFSMGFDVCITPSMEFKYTPFEYPRRYFVVQTNAGTMKYGPGKNWVNVGWVNEFIAQCRAGGLACILTGTENPGIEGADDQKLSVPIPELLGLIRGAEFVLGLQGFTTIAGFLMGRRILLKRENPMVIVHHVHPAWYPRMKLFGEPAAASEAWVRGLSEWALRREGVAA